jgi:hypothetical protein
MASFGWCCRLVKLVLLSCPGRLVGQEGGAMADSDVDPGGVRSREELAAALRRRRAESIAHLVAAEILAACREGIPAANRLKLAAARPAVRAHYPAA